MSRCEIIKLKSLSGFEIFKDFDLGFSLLALTNTKQMKVKSTFQGLRNR